MRSARTHQSWKTERGSSVTRNHHFKSKYSTTWLPQNKLFSQIKILSACRNWWQIMQMINFRLPGSGQKKKQLTNNWTRLYLQLMRTRSLQMKTKVCYYRWDLTCCSALRLQGGHFLKESGLCWKCKFKFTSNDYNQTIIFAKAARNFFYVAVF